MNKYSRISSEIMRHKSNNVGVTKQNIINQVTDYRIGLDKAIKQLYVIKNEAEIMGNRLTVSLLELQINELNSISNFTFNRIAEIENSKKIEWNNDTTKTEG